MESVTTPANPFALLLDPKAIFDQIEHSERLERLQRRICRPLDKPLLPVEPGTEPAAQSTEAFDLAIDAGEMPSEI